MFKMIKLEKSFTNKNEVVIIELKECLETDDKDKKFKYIVLQKYYGGYRDIKLLTENELSTEIEEYKKVGYIVNYPALTDGD